MKDFCTLREIDIQALLRMARYAEEAEEFNMAGYITKRNSCGTAGCLVGTFCFAEGLLDNVRTYELNSITCEIGRERFGISQHEVDFIFHGGHLKYLNFPIVVSRRSATDADLQTKEEAIRRLRLFIIYKMRKAELLTDYEASRRLEGNQGYARRARVEAEGVGI